jgi:hypothetical protein
MPKQEQNIDDVIGQLSGQLAQAQAIKQQQVQEKKKDKSLKQIVGESYAKVTNTVKNLPLYKEKALTGLDGILGSGIRSTATTFAMAATALPIALINPVGAVLAAGAAGAYAYLGSNTVYKLCRDSLYLATYPLVRPKQFFGIIPAILKNPLGFVSGLISKPFELVGGALTYPFKVKRIKKLPIKSEDGRPVGMKAGTNKYARMAGQLFGGIGGAGLLYGNPLNRLGDLAVSAKDYIVNFANGAAAKYAPAYAYK